MSHPVLEVRILPITELIPASYNPRKILQPTDEAYRKLKRSIEEFGLVEPLIWNELTGRVVGGHARLRILRELGYREVPVSVVRLSDAREKALNVMLNNHEAQGRYDPTLLANLLTELRELPEMNLTGFAPSVIASLSLQALETIPAEESSNRVEIILVTDATRFAALQSRLDEVIREFDLEVHVKR